MEYQLDAQAVTEYTAALTQAERAPGTVAKYRRDLTAFSAFLAGQPVTAQTVAAWKAYLLQSHAPRTVNSMLAAVNGFCRFRGWNVRITYLKLQRSTFRDPGRELTKTEYQRLLSAARSRSPRLTLLMQTLCATGIRVSELRYITVEAARSGRATIALKGKIRTILLPGKLCKKLLSYAGQQKTASGEIFLTKSGRGISRRQIWYELKRLCAGAGVEPGKVFPHNFRHLFATVFYAACRDIARLADMLGHSSIETTRIYLTISADQQTRQLERLGLIS